MQAEMTMTGENGTSAPQSHSVSSSSTHPSRHSPHAVGSLAKTESLKVGIQRNEHTEPCLMDRNEHTEPCLIDVLKDERVPNEI